MALLENECNCSGGAIIGDGGNQTLIAVKIVFELYVLSGSGDTKTLGASPGAQGLVLVLVLMATLYRW